MLLVENVAILQTTLQAIVKTAVLMQAVSDLKKEMASSEQQPQTQPQQPPPTVPATCTTKPTTEAIYNCTNCDIKFDSESSLRVHLQVRKKSADLF